jgi:hypothetical protein
MDYTHTASAATNRERTAEQWARAVFEDASAATRWFLRTGWRTTLAAHLAPTGTPDHILGWPIATNTADHVTLALPSTFVTARLEFQTTADRVTVTTHVRHEHPASRPVWAVVCLVHEQVLPRLVARAATDGPGTVT